MRFTARAATAMTLAGLVLQSSLILAAGIGAAKKPPAKKAAAPSAASGGATALIAAGKKVYDAKGCAACHVIGGKGGNAGPDLSATGAVPTHTVQWLSVQIANPKAHNPDSTMPGFAQTVAPKDLTAMSTYLASLKGASASSGATAAVHHGPPPNPAAVAQIEKLGGLVGPIAQNDDHLDVNLHLAGASVTDASLTPLVSLKGVQRLDLGTTGITDAGLQKLKGMKELTELHLEGTKVTDAGMPIVGELKALTYLNLYNTAITDVGLTHLTHLSNLKHLYVWQTKVTPDGVDKLKKALPQVDIVMGWETPAAPKK